MIYESDEAMDAIACGNVGGALNWKHLSPVLPKRGCLGTSVLRSSDPRGTRPVVLVVLGHGLAPVSASGGVAGDDHADEEDDVAHDEEDGHAAATPDA